MCTNRVINQLEWENSAYPGLVSRRLSTLTHISLCNQDHEKKFPLQYHKNSVPTLIDT